VPGPITRPPPAVRRRAAVALVAILALSGCSSSGAGPSSLTSSAPAGSTSPPPVAAPPVAPERETAGQLLRVARVFNDEYGRNDDGPVYDRWDARSRAVISRADYIRRHLECATAPEAPAHVESARPGPGGEWLVRYEIGGQQFTDFWFYRDRHWVFDLLLSNPAAARLYRLPFARYATEVGCQGR